MEYYYPARPTNEDRLTLVPAGAHVIEDWREAFRWALCPNAGMEEESVDVAEGAAVLYVIEMTIPFQTTAAEKEAVAWKGRRLTSNSTVHFWYQLADEMPVKTIINVNTDAWMLAATRARLSGERHETLEQIFRSIVQEEPVVVSDLDGVVQIRPAAVGEIAATRSLTQEALKAERRHRTLFGKSPTK